MRFKEYKIVLAVIFAPLLVLWGCQGNKPLSPSKVSNLSVSIPTAGLRPKASLLGTDYDVIYYNISGPLSSPVTGIASITSSSPSTEAGTDSFTISNVPIGPGEILSIQLNDGNSTNQSEPLGIGAESLNLSGSNNTVDVQMGSVSRSCYQVSMSLASCSQDYDEEFNFETYGYDDDEMEFVSNTSGNYYYNYDGEINDVAFLDYGEYQQGTCSGTYDLTDAWTGNNNTIAYLGQGNLVNYDYVPGVNGAPGQFYPAASVAKQEVGAGSTITAGDVYCVKLQGGTTTSPEYTWLQIVDDGQNAVPWFNNGGGSLGYPSFIYRVNTNVPYYRYEQTTADVDVSTGGAAGFCSLVFNGD